MQWPWTPSQMKNPIDLHRRTLLNDTEFGAGAWDQSLDDTDYFVFDIETSDFSVKKGIVLSVAAATSRIDASPTIDTLQYYLIAHKDLSIVPDKIWRLTGLSPELLRNGVDLKSVLFEVLQLADKKVWIAHHARHELSFLHRYTRDFWKMRIQPIIIDTALVAQALLGQSFVPTLDEVCHWLDVPIGSRHRADADVTMTALVWQKEAKLCQSRGLQTVGEVLEWTRARA
ncbi:PolC-type DNA polymerase III [Alicyclobacillus sp. SO9]|uniref:3'-5' exonuclease n=1 Tax=Alicyclobacillus sp. SO9 TaxID=2665646 RepID=UPI0018E83809|nr:exonuclease domain-containing protein [Alicyclobacillus sp. SO9]QQE79841.1 DNA polymerase III subunit epsilon [Alicyclobacillus sp. SO9]